MEGYGTFGIVYSCPRFPFKKKFNFNNEKIVNEENILELICNDQVSKIFFKKEFYELEKIDYYRLLKYNLPDIFFNKPLHYGTIDDNRVFKYRDIYNYNWSGNKYDFKKIITNCSFQITFPKGKLIQNNNYLTVDNFYENIENLFNLIKYLNYNDILFDDFKVSNILDINGIYKVSDFSSLIKIEELNKNNFRESFLNVSSYYIYLPILNETIKYYIYFDKYKDLLDSDFYTSKKCIDEIIDNIANNLKTNIEINFLDTNNKNIKINILSILDEMKNYKLIINKNEIYYNSLISYLDNKYYNNYKKIENVCKRINLYSFGIFLLYILSKKNYIENIEYSDDSIEIKLLEIICHACLNFIIIDNETYIFEPNIDFIMSLYSQNKMKN